LVSSITDLKLSPGVVVNKFITNNEKLSLTKQVELLGVSRSSLYYQPVPTDFKTLEIMNQIDEIYTEQPFYGSRRIAVILSNKRKEKINRKVEASS